jgi:hypothetical protein
MDEWPREVSSEGECEGWLRAPSYNALAYPKPHLSGSVWIRLEPRRREAVERPIQPVQPLLRVRLALDTQVQDLHRRKIGAQGWGA